MQLRIKYLCKYMFLEFLLSNLDRFSALTQRVPVPTGKTPSHFLLSSSNNFFCNQSKKQSTVPYNHSRTHKPKIWILNVSVSILVLPVGLSSFAISSASLMALRMQSRPDMLQTSRPSGSCHLLMFAPRQRVGGATESRRSYVFAIWSMVCCGSVLITSKSSMQRRSHSLYISPLARLAYR